MQNLPAPTYPSSRSTLPIRHATSSVKRVLSERMLLSEALEAAGRIVGAYPNGGAAAGKSYIGSLASTLCSYPRQVALLCAPSSNPLDPPRGVVLETKFLPTVADIVAWCERNTDPLRRDSDREDRITAQIEAREAWQTQERDPALAAKCQAWLDRTDPQAKQMVDGSPEDRAEASRRLVRAEEQRGRDVAETHAQWAAEGQQAPTIAGMPISKELAGKLGARGTQDATADTAAA